MSEHSLVGRQLANYRLERLLGSGGMAQVYYAWDVKLERPAAIKVIDARYRGDPAYAQRFIREARAVATWRHDNVIQIYYADDQDGLYFFAMEYIEGMDMGQLLDQYAADGELMTHEDVLFVGRAVAAALDYAHERGVIHRDVKPANVMVTGGGRVVLTDFGLAMDVHMGTLGQVFGSPHYIAPEQARSSANAGPLSDLYSLGVMLYEMLTGAVPFDDPSATTLALQHVMAPPPPPREINPRLNAQTEAVLLRALSKAPEDRYPSGQALIEALESALAAAAEPPAGMELPPPPPGVTPAPPRSLSRLTAAEQVTSYLDRRSAAAPAPAAAPSLLGRQLDEYRLDAPLGRGGMARIYRGLDVRLKRQVAIKVIDTPLRDDADYIERFEREAQAIARLEHAHIVRLYRYGEDQGVLYMAMQYVEGADLEATLERYRQAGETIPPSEASRIVRQVCLALDYAHSQGIIHRDVKPSNIMLDREGHVYLADFGLALLSELGTQGQIFGSPHYIAPEQVVSSANVVPQSDLYAVGVMLYQMFAGRTPFDTEDPLDMAMLHMTTSPPPPREVNPAISPALEQVILKALAKEPAARYQTGAELADALDQALAPAPARVQAVAPAPAAAQLAAVPSTTAPLAAAPPAFIPPPTAGPAAVSLASMPPGPPAQPAPAPARRRGKWLILVLSGAGACVTLFILAGLGLLVLRPLWKSTPAAPTSAVAGRIGTPGTPSETRTGTPAPLPIILSSATVTVTTLTAAPTQTLTATTTLTVVATTFPVVVATTPAVTATSTAAPTQTPLPTATSAPVRYELLLVANREDSLFLLNQSAGDLSLPALRFSGEAGVLEGAEWGIPSLGSGQCVAVWKATGQPKPPKEIECEPVGAELQRDGPSTFWKKSFEVHVSGTRVGACDAEPKECIIRFEIRMGQVEPLRSENEHKEDN